MAKRRALTQHEIECADRLKTIWNMKKGELSLTQESAASLMGWSSQGAVSQYLNKAIPLNTDAKLKFAELLQVRVSDIDPLMSGAVGMSNYKKQIGKAAEIPCLNGTIELSADFLGDGFVCFIYESADFADRWDTGDILLIDTKQNNPELGLTYLFKDMETSSHILKRYTRNESTGKYGLVTDADCLLPSAYVDRDTIQARLGELDCIGRVRMRITDRI